MICVPPKKMFQLQLAEVLEMGQIHHFVVSFFVFCLTTSTCKNMIHVMVNPLEVIMVLLKYTQIIQAMDDHFSIETHVDLGMSPFYIFETPHVQGSLLELAGQCDSLAL